MKKVFWYYAVLKFELSRAKMTHDLMLFYFHDLSEFSIENIEQAAKAYVRSGDKFPLVSDFIRLLSA